MALADIPSGGPPRRLDSWKEIAEYLRRDVRTATRWESQGLPLHRVAGGKGRSVFAFTNEIDAWMASHPAEAQAEIVVSEASPVALAPEGSPHSRRTIAISVACTLAVIAVGAVVMSSGAETPLDLASLQITEAPTHLSITDASGASRVLHQYKPGAGLATARSAQFEDLDADGVSEILTAVAYYATDDGPFESGELLDLSIAGDVRWRFSFNDVMAFGARRASSPWMITDWRAEPDSSLKRVAIAAHEQQWWASIVTVLDHTGSRREVFVNPGWIERLLWWSSDRLAIAGYNNKREEGMLAMLDVAQLGGQAPGSAGTEFECLTCPSTPPIFYATFPRSEVNTVGAGGFIRTRLSTAGDRLVVNTVELVRAQGAAAGIYEFDRDLRFMTARYSDTYWYEHGRLEREGRLTHSREKCPERAGPAAIHVWDAARGWIRTTPSGGS